MMFAQALLLSGFAAGALAQLTTTAAAISGAAQTTITAFGIDYSSGFVGSVVGANACKTTMVITCTADNLCGRADDVPLTLTVSSDGFELVFATATLGATGSISENCKVLGPATAPSSAVCVLAESVSANGQHTATTTTITTAGTAVPYNPIPITAGADKLASATGSCTASGNAAAATGFPEIYKVIVPVGAALVGAAFV